MKLDKSKLELSRTTYELFQTAFTKIYEAFNKGRKVVIVRQSWWKVEDKDKISAGLWLESYYHLKRVIANLNFQGFVKVYRRKPPRPPNTPAGERIYSFLEVHPTEKGFKAFKNGARCSVPTTVTYNYDKYTDASVRQTGYRNNVGIGKGYPGFEYLREKYYDPVKVKLKIAKTRWAKDWEHPIHELFAEKLVNLHEEEAKVEIEALIDKLIPTLPKNRRVAKIKASLEKNQRLEQFISLT